MRSDTEVGVGARPAGRRESGEVNAAISRRLDEVARVLADQNANPFRVRAYERAAETVRGWPVPLDKVASEGGTTALAELPGIGESLARSIYQLATIGWLPMLERLRGESDPVQRLESVVGIGPRTAHRIRDELGIHTLEELEMAAHDGRLQRELGIGPKRIAGIRDALAGRLGRARGRRPVSGVLPDVGEILDVDAEYRRECERGSLPRIAPRRFNPTGEAWLPVLHTMRGDRHYTALFSNTARAHQLGRTRDWVILYFDGQDGERQCTVITAELGPLRGRRIVRGRERECAAYHAVD
jgi:hypothetical protein